MKRDFWDRIARKLGYVPEDVFKMAHTRAVQAERRHEQLERMKEQAIIKAIIESRVYSARMQEGMEILVANTDGDFQPFVKIEARDPVTPNRYAATVEIDMAVLQRVRQDLELQAHSYEMDYFIQTLIHRIATDIEALMRLDRLDIAGK